MKMMMTKMMMVITTRESVLLQKIPWSLDLDISSGCFQSLGSNLTPHLRPLCPQSSIYMSRGMSPQKKVRNQCLVDPGTR